MRTGIAEAELNVPHVYGAFDADRIAAFDDRLLLDPAFRTALLRHHTPTGFTELAAELADRLVRPPYFVVLRGLTFDPNDVLFSLLTASLGTPVRPPDPTYRVVRELRPRESSRSQRWGVLTEWLHTDSTNWPVPHEVTLMQCRAADQAGEGNSLVLPLDAALRVAVGHFGAGVIDRLRGVALPWALDSAFGAGTTWAPALDGSGVRWQLYRLDEAVTRDGASVPVDELEFLGLLDQLWRDSDAVREFALAENDTLIINNRCTIHARRPVRDEAGSRRAMVHSKVDLSDDRSGYVGLAEFLGSHAY